MTLMARRASDLRPATAQNPPLKDSSAQCYTLDWERSLCKSKLETSIRLPAICPLRFIFPFGVGFLMDHSGTNGTELRSRWIWRGTIRNWLASVALFFLKETVSPKGNIFQRSSFPSLMALFFFNETNLNQADESGTWNP